MRLVCVYRAGAETSQSAAAQDINPGDRYSSGGRPWWHAGAQDEAVGVVRHDRRVVPVRTVAVPRPIHHHG